jgi:uncharacterized protein YcfJ
MNTPNWQHHSKKEQKRTLKPQSMRQAKKRRAALKAKLLAALVALVGIAPANAESIGDRSNRQAYQSQGGYAREEKCYRNEYREEYVPGTSQSPGYVKTFRERVAVPCERHRAPQKQHQTDNNSCIEGSILGGIAGGGAGAALSRGDGRYWAIPLGIVGGALVGCQIDGG